MYGKEKKIVKKYACMKFYDVAKPLYLEMDISSVSLGARSLQVRVGMNCRHDEVPDNATLYLIAFTNKSLLNNE